MPQTYSLSIDNLELESLYSVLIDTNTCDNIRKKYINNGTDAWRQYISAKIALFKSSFANGVVTCVVVMKCEWELKCKQMSAVVSCCLE